MRLELSILKLSSFGFCVHMPPRGRTVRLSALYLVTSFPVVFFSQTTTHTTSSSTTHNNSYFFGLLRKVNGPPSHLKLRLRRHSDDLLRPSCLGCRLTYLLHLFAALFDTVPLLGAGYSPNPQIPRHGDLDGRCNWEQLRDPLVVSRQHLVFITHNLQTCYRPHHTATHVRL